MGGINYATLTLLSILKALNSMRLIRLIHKNLKKYIFNYNEFNESIYKELAKYDPTIGVIKPLTYSYFQDIQRFCYLIEVDDTLIGIIQLFRRNSTVELELLYIAPAHRRLGYGTLAIQTALQELTAKYTGTYTITLDVYAENTQAAQLYTNLGFSTLSKTMVCNIEKFTRLND